VLVLLLILQQHQQLPLQVTWHQLKVASLICMTEAPDLHLHLTISTTTTTTTIHMPSSVIVTTTRKTVKMKIAKTRITS
jgi:hypothetical protein